MCFTKYSKRLDSLLYATGDHSYSSLQEVFENPIPAETHDTCEMVMFSIFAHG